MLAISSLDPRHVEAAVRRWLYRGGRAHRFAALANRAQVLVAVAGLPPACVAVLEVRGRRTGRLRALPVVVADYDGERYLVAMLGTGSNWVANMRAAGGDVVLRRRHREQVHLVEVPVDERAPILRRYVNLAEGARAHIPVDRHAPLSEFETIAPRYPIFRVAPR
jgi:deazaflavin-dependent oxidoreductase (nitroreductase family)